MGSLRATLTGGVAAGYVADHAVEPGTAMRIMTGAPVPPGADTVIQVELTRSEGPESEWVEILQAVEPGKNIRPAGEDMRRGQRSCYTEQRSDRGNWRTGNAGLGKCASDTPPSYSNTGNGR